MRIAGLIGTLLAAAAAAEKPNIILIVADDMGWADVGYHGSPIRTPNIDRLAGEGIELERFYVAPVCTPTRAAVLTASRYK
jgi:arylsulfatase A-like enzyme